MAEDAADLQCGAGRRQTTQLREKLVTALSADSTFKDHFSTRSKAYARYRPTYPAELFEFLASICNTHQTAADVATGNGQAAVALTEHFSSVTAIDASQAQIEAAISNTRVSYRVAKAEKTGLADQSVDLLTVAQAFHWFDEDAFMIEAQRVLRPNGVLAIWCYRLCRVSEQCDEISDRLYADIVGDYWPRERTLIEQGYSALKLPGRVVETPSIEMSLEWTAADMLGYLRTWSATKRYMADKGHDPVSLIEEDIREAWGSAARRAVWPLEIRVSRANSLLE